MSQPNTSEKSNDLDRQENLTRGQLSAKKVVLYTYDASSDTLIPVGNSAVTERYDYDDPTTIYTASAPVGTLDADLGWTITKYDLSDTNNASGKVATDVSWNNRATGSFA